MTQSLSISVVGCGSWGTALANVLADNGHSVTLWGRHPDQLSEIESKRQNSKYLPGIDLCASLRTEPNLEKALSSAEVVLCAVPTQAIRSVFSKHSALLAEKNVVNASKGVEKSTLVQVSEIFSEISPTARYSVLSGPNFAKEVVQRLPSATTVASKDMGVAVQVQKLFSNEYFRVYTSHDVVGAELGGALKNVVAIAAGIVSGLKLGYNAQAAVINRGMAEIMRMARARGADPLTFLGLSGMGDLVLTCTGPLSRNRTLGVALGEGKTFEQARSELGGVAEGYFTTDAVYELSRKREIEMPVADQIYHILYQGRAPMVAVKELMRRDLKHEWS